MPNPLEWSCLLIVFSVMMVTWTPGERRRIHFFKGVEHDKNTAGMMPAAHRMNGSLARGAAGVEKALNPEKYAVVRYDPATDLAG
jgi:hypothetical protein